MRYLTLADKRVSVIGVGVWQFGSRSWGWGSEFGPSDARAIVQRALDMGVNLFDTAEIYARGRSEALLAASLDGRRDEAFIASKVWPLRVLPGQVRGAARRSLARLATDRMELYQAHWPNPAAPLSWTIAGMRDLLNAGKIGAAGVSNFSMARWRRAEAMLGRAVVSDQVPYNLLDRRAERELLPFAERNERTIIAYSPLAQGLLSGRYGPENAPGGFRRFNGLFTVENMKRAAPVIETLREVAQAHRVTPAQAALAWVVRRPNVVAIPGAKSLRQLEENAEAADIELSPDEAAALDDASAAFKPVAAVRNLRQLATRLLLET